MNTRLTLLLAALALSACGKLESDKTHPAGASSSTQNVGSTSLSADQFTSQCQSKKGIITASGTVCLAVSAASLADADPRSATPPPAYNTGDTVDIDSNFTNGKFLVLSSSSSQVLVTLNGAQVASGNFRGVINKGNGRLAYYIVDPNHHVASAVSYTCYNRSMAMVACQAAWIP